MKQHSTPTSLMASVGQKSVYPGVRRRGAGALLGGAKRIDATQINIMTAKMILAQALDMPRAGICDNAPIDILITDSLVFEVVAMEIEDFLGKEVDRLNLMSVKTVSDLGNLIRREIISMR